MTNRSRTWLLVCIASVIVLSIAALWKLSWKRTGLVGDKDNTPSTTSPEPGELSDTASGQGRREVPAVIEDSELLSRFDGMVVCQAVRPQGKRTPLQAAHVRLQTIPASSIESFSEGVANERGVVALSVPVQRPFVLHGFYEGTVARLALPALTQGECEALYPSGIQLDFFLDPVVVRYSIKGAGSALDGYMFLKISSTVIDRVVLPRDGDHVDVIRPLEEDEVAAGQFHFLAGEELHWALVDHFGLPVASGRSGHVLRPAEEYMIDVELAQIRARPMRYFRISAGRELFAGLFMSSIQFHVHDREGEYYGLVQATVSDDGTFCLALPEKDMILVLQHQRTQAIELTITASDGLEPSDPIEFAVSPSVRVFLRRSDWPQLPPGYNFTISLESGRRINGTLIESDESPDDLELLSGWSPIVQTFRLGDNLCLARLPEFGIVRVPGPHVVISSLPSIVDCVVELHSADVMEDVVELVFFVRGELWQLHRVYAPMRTRATFETRLPLEAGTVAVREGTRPSVVLPYAVGEGGRVSLRWFNH